jgi:hypothetical protein
VNLVPFLIAVIAELSATHTFNFGASNIFLNRCFTIRACFGIFLNPLLISFLAIQQFFPLDHILACCRIMRLFPAKEAVKLPTLALNTQIKERFSALAK